MYKGKNIGHIIYLHYMLDVDQKPDNPHSDDGTDYNGGDVAARVAGLANSKDSIAHWAVVGELPEARETTHL